MWIERATLGTRRPGKARCIQGRNRYIESMNQWPPQIGFYDKWWRLKFWKIYWHGNRLEYSNINQFRQQKNNLKWTEIHWYLIRSIYEEKRFPPYLQQFCYIFNFLVWFELLLVIFVSRLSPLLHLLNSLRRIVLVYNFPFMIYIHNSMPTLF